MTHRGPVITDELLKNAESLFGTKLPAAENSTYSLVWSGAQPRETFFSFVDSILESKTFLQLGSKIAKLKTWGSLPVNVVVADSSNIGYMLLSASPIRRDSYPFIGQQVLDGSTSKHDWIGIQEIT